MQKTILIVLALLTSFWGYSQKQNNVWCFGDSAGIDFNNSQANPLITSLDTRGSCVSISDSNGQLIFYAHTRATIAGNTTLVNNRLNQLITNGNNIVGEGWYHELVIVPFPSVDTLFYLFSGSVTGSSIAGFYFSVIDVSFNNGLGSVIQKNIQLQSFKQVDCLSAVKHGNGRDWWVVFRKFVQGVGNDEFYSYLITPGGISSVTVQTVGSLNATGLAKLSFSPDGTKMLFTNYGDLIELYNFDRCSGVISNPRTINPQGTTLFYNTWGSEFSPSGDLLYISTSDTVSYLFQYNLSDVNPQATRDTIWSTQYPQYTGGDLKRGPDGKIYFSCAYDNQIVFNYPYPDSMYNMYNMNLSVINSPDSLGMACDFQPYSFYLGGNRTYWGLPNNPDYDLGPLVGSACDSLTALQENELNNNNAILNLYFHPGWETLFVNAQNLKGTKGTIKIYDTNGKIIYSSPCIIQPPYFTKDIVLPGLANGIYVVQLQTDKELLVGKVGRW